MKYKIKEVSKILNIPVDTLRYYEKIGVISPKIDESNHYRYYDAWDINYILEYMNYRKMDYSSQEIIEFIHHAALKEQIVKVRQKQHYYQKQQEYYKMLCQRNERFLEALKNVEQDLNTIRFVEAPPRRYIVYRNNYRFQQMEEVKTITSQWMKNYPFIEDVVIIPKETIEKRTDNAYAWSFAISTELFEYFSLEENEYIQSIPASLCLRTLVDAGEHGMFHYHLLDHVMKFIRQHHFYLKGNPYGILLTRVHDGDAYHRYIDFYVPIAYDSGAENIEL